MRNIALEEAQKLQERIDELVKERDSLKPVFDENDLKEANTLRDMLEKVESQLDRFEERIEDERNTKCNECETRRRAINVELSTLITGRNALLQTAQGQ